MKPTRDIDNPEAVGRELGAVFLDEWRRKAQHAPAVDDDGFYRDHEAQAANDYVRETLAEVVPFSLRRRYQQIDPGDAAA